MHEIYLVVTSSFSGELYCHKVKLQNMDSLGVFTRMVSKAARRQQLRQRDPPICI